MSLGKYTFLRSTRVFAQALLFLVGLSASIYAQSPFQLIGKSTVIGLETNYDVGPGPAAGTQRFYATFFNESPGGTFSLLSIDPGSGNTEVFKSPLAGEFGAWGMAVGPDGNIYLGTTPSAHFMVFNPATNTLTDLGRPSSTETYIWAIAFGSDQKLYGVTYPNCKLVRYDPASGQLADLGRLDAVEQYAHSIAATADGYIYAGIGPNSANIAVYQISTGTIHELMATSGEPATFPTLHVGLDGKAYAQAGSEYFKLSPTAATQITASQVSAALPHNQLANGSFVTLATNIASSGAYALDMTVANSKLGTSTTKQLSYAGEAVNVWRLGAGPNNTIYGSTILPADLFRINASQNGLDHIGNVGSGEVYSFETVGNNLAMAAYYGTASLMSYNSAAAFGGSGASQNPKLQSYSGSDPGWRPQAIAEGADGHLYAGGQAPYGQFNGPLVEWDPASATAQIDTTMANQLIASLVPWQNEVIGGTSTVTGSTRTTAKLFAWNTVTHQVDWTITPVAGAGVIADLVSASNGLIYGIADNTVFEFDPATTTVKRTVSLGFPLDGGNLYDSVGQDSAGRIWGLAPGGIFVIDTGTLYGALIAPSPVPVNHGWAMSNGDIYFTSGASVYRYTLPTAAGHIAITPAQTSFASNAPLQVSVTVTGSNPTGTVTLAGGTYKTSPVALKNGTATFTIPANSFTPGTSASISVFYSGDTLNLYSNTSIAVSPTVSGAKVSVGLGASSLLVGQSLGVSVAVSGNSASPTGTATVSAGTYKAQATLSTGTAKFTVPAGSFAPGADVVSVSYSGDSHYGAATGSASLTVMKATPTVVLTTPGTSIPVGSAIPIGVKVTGATGTPTGTATLTAGSYTAKVSLTSGSATFSIPAGSLALGTAAVSVSYGGDTGYLTGGATGSVTEIKAIPTVSISPATLTASTGTAQTFKVTVAGKAGTPTGSITLWAPGYSLGTVALAAGSATFAVPAGRFAAGSITLTASYGGNGNYTAATGNASLTETK